MEASQLPRGRIEAIRDQVTPTQLIRNDHCDCLGVTQRAQPTMHSIGVRDGGRESNEGARDGGRLDETSVALLQLDCLLIIRGARAVSSCLDLVKDNVANANTAAIRRRQHQHVHEGWR